MIREESMRKKKVNERHEKKQGEEGEQVST